MAQAPHADQLILLDVADLDARIARLERDNRKHPLREKLGALLNSTAAKAREIEGAKGELEAARGRLAAAERSSGALQAQISDKDEKLNSGIGLTSRDLLVLQDEIAALRIQLDQASDEEFNALDAVENAEGAIARLQNELSELTDQTLKDRAALEDAVTIILADQNELRAKREALYAPLADNLKKIYEHSRASGGYAVMALMPNGQTGQGVVLSPVEVAQIRALPEDEIYLSEDYDAIVVRVDA
ncbi:hypothetical protein I6E29_03780 [Arcanobacterium haemolyticum]|nr:hypothetical protein [Arcanobacterium haemolyticum]